MRNTQRVFESQGYNDFTLSRIVLPNGVKDAIENGQYVQKVKRYVLQASDIDQFDNTNYTNYDAIRFLKPNNSVGYSNQTDSWMIVTGYRDYKAGLLDTADRVGTFTTTHSVTRAYLCVSKGTYANLAAAQAALAGTVIYYQLATPIITQYPLTLTEVKDRSRYANNAILSGGAAYKKVGDNYVLDFTSATAKATIAKNASINDLKQFTFRGWVYRVGSGGEGFGRLLVKGGKYLLVSGSESALYFLHPFSTTSGMWSSPVNSLPIGGWYCIQITYDNSSVGNNAVIMINGVSVSVARTAPVGVASTDASNDLVLGNTATNDRNLNGYLAEVEILSGIATVAEGKRWYNSVCLRYGLQPIA